MNPLPSQSVKPRKSRVTLAEVASEVGVNISTASRALNPEKRELLAPEMVKKVLTAADKLGYYPNRVASALAKNQSNTIGLIIPDLANPIWPAIIKGIHEICQKQGYSLIMDYSDGDSEYETQILRGMRERAVDGCLLATSKRIDPLVQDCLDKGLPIVLINRTTDAGGVTSVTTDDQKGIRAAVDHLYSLNHRKIAHIAGPQSVSTGFDRYEAFILNMLRKGLSYDLIEIASSFSIEAGKKAFTTLLDRDKSFTAVLAANDRIALGCIDAITEAGMRCPEDISVVGFNDMPFLDRMQPGLTSVAIPHYQIGLQAAQRLIETIQNPNAEHVATKLQPQLVIRGSTSVAGE